MTSESPLNVGSRPHITCPLVGRSNELSVLRSGLELASEGRSTLFVITGEPGIGKTRLAREIAAEAVGKGFVVEWGRAYECSRTQLWPWFKILQPLSVNYPPPALTTSIESSFSQTSANVSAQEDELGNWEGGRFDFAWLQYCEKVAASLKQAARRKALLLILDDLHNADRGSMELLRFLSHEFHDSAIMLVAVARDFEIKRSEFLHELLPDLARNGTHLTLSGLGSDAISQLIEATTGAKTDLSDVSSIIAATAGNPFLLLELLKFRTPPVVSAVNNGHRSRFPNALVATINQLLDSLSAGCLEVLRVASAIGRQFDFRILEYTLTSETDELPNLLDEALDANILRETAEVPGRYLFTHGVMRDALHQQINRSERLRLHRRIADVLRELFSRCPEGHFGEIATHYFEGDSAEKALEYFEKAAARANLLCEFGAAARFYSMAVTAFELSAHPDDAHRCDLLIELAVAHSRAGEQEQAELIFCEAVRMAERLGDAERLARAIINQPTYYPVMLRLINQETVHLLSTASEELEAETPLTIRMKARLGWELWLDTGSRTEGYAIVARAVEMARSTEGQEVLLDALLAYDIVLSDPDRISERIKNATAIVDLGTQLHDYRAICRGSLAQIMSFSALGDTTRADSIAYMMAAASEMAHEPLLQWAVLGHLACKSLREGHFEQGREYVNACLALARRAGDSEIVDLVWPALIAVWQEKEGLEELCGLAFASYNRRPHLPLYGALLARLYCEQDRTSEAKLYFDKIATKSFSAVRRDGLFLATLAALSEVSIRLNDTHRAAELYELLLPYKHLNIVIGPATLMGPASYYLARLAGVLSRLEAAQQHCSDAIQLSRETGAVCWAASAEYELCRALLQADRHSEIGNALLDSLIVTARHCCMPKLEQAAVALRLSLSNCLPTSLPLASACPADSNVDRSIEQTLEMQQDTNGYQREVLTNGDATAVARPNADRIFRREADYWVLSYGGKTVRLRHLKGFALIACLLRYPGRRFLAAGLAMSAGEGSQKEISSANQMDSSPLLDTKAKASYRERLQQLREDLDEARSFNDQARVAKSENEIAFLTRELARALGIFGRDRTFPSNSERARLRVTNSIRAAIKKVCAAHSSLGRHLANSIKTGSFCSYTPESSAEESWQV
jgi:predicted ATPase